MKTESWHHGQVRNDLAECCLVMYRTLHQISRSCNPEAAPMAQRALHTLAKENPELLTQMKRMST